MAPRWTPQNAPAPDALTWTCRDGHVNDPKRHLLCYVPTFHCECGCGEKFKGDFEFCMGDIKANGHRLLGVPLDQGEEGDCVAYAYAKTLEISRRVKELLQNRDPGSVPEMNPKDLVDKYEYLTGGKDRGLSKVAHMGLIIKEQGISSKDSSVLYKVSEVCTIKRNDYEAIVTALADGHPLHAGFLCGKKLEGLKFCTSYKPPSYKHFLKKNQFPEPHSVVLVGAGRKHGKWHFFFMNSWKNFCCRHNHLGVKLRDGVGKIRSKRLWRNVVRLSRFKEPMTERSLEHQDRIEISERNYDLLTSTS